MNRGDNEDDKKHIKEFINYICDWVEYKLIVNSHYWFSHQLGNDRMAYLIADKGIERILNQCVDNE
ncbi:hypothetical protein H7E67_17665 [Clostridium gasigenes]|uniref:hypothetical protein n=1 Tax=Clostridium gasigenes TaxID=94869 RepID=UPI001628432A|nr:hypothetical protein [Clostridium gasigenes]MBB6625246.1 hypothetical protein [Clostridium gasigenes]